MATSQSSDVFFLSLVINEILLSNYTAIMACRLIDALKWVKSKLKYSLITPGVNCG